MFAAGPDAEASKPLKINRHAEAVIAKKTKAKNRHRQTTGDTKAPAYTRDHNHGFVKSATDFTVLETK